MLENTYFVLPLHTESENICNQTVKMTIIINIVVKVRPIQQVQQIGSSDGEDPHQCLGAKGDHIANLTHAANFTHTTNLIHAEIVTNGGGGPTAMLEYRKVTTQRIGSHSKFRPHSNAVEYF